MCLGALHVGTIADGAAERHLAVLDLDLDAARIESDIVGKAFTEIAGNIGIAVPVACGLAHLGQMVFGFDAVDLAHAKLPRSSDQRPGQERVALAPVGRPAHEAGAANACSASKRPDPRRLPNR
jgi:hypothetical protein